MEGSSNDDINVKNAWLTIADKSNTTGAFDKLTSPGDHPELFRIINNGTIINNGYIYPGTSGGGSDVIVVAALVGSVNTQNDTWLYLYSDGTYLAKFADGTRLTRTYRFDGDMLIFIISDGTVVTPEKDSDGNWLYSFTTKSGYSVEFVLDAVFVEQVHQECIRLGLAA